MAVVKDSKAKEMIVGPGVKVDGGHLSKTKDTWRTEESSNQMYNKTPTPCLLPLSPCWQATEMQVTQPVSVLGFIPIHVHSLWTVSPERRPFGFIDSHILQKDINVQRNQGWSAGGGHRTSCSHNKHPKPLRRDAANWHDVDTGLWCVATYGEVNSVSRYHTVVFAGHAEYRSTSLHTG